MRNNLFDFGTSELSQDAFICWCINWVKEAGSKLFNLGVDTLKMLGYSIKPGEIVKIKRQDNKIDILIELPESRRKIIVEDKTYTSERDNQIERYKESLVSSEWDVTTVFFKTGHFYDCDRLIQKRKKADVVIDGKMFLNLLKKYYGRSDILDDYVEHLESLLNWYVIHGNYTKKVNDEKRSWFISKYQIAQYNLIKDIFNGEKYNTWETKGDRYYTYSGSSFGRPWTEMIVIPYREYSDSFDKYTVFWRIDTDRNGPYMSLRLYENMDKADSKTVERHERMYITLKNKIKDIIEKNDYSFSWKDVQSGNKGRSKESSMISFCLVKVLENWNNLGSRFIHEVRDLTEKFIEANG